MINMSSKITDLVKAAKNGNADSFGELYELYAKDMYRFAYYYLSSEQYAQDAVSECVIIAYEKISSLKRNDSFKSWLFKILHNCCNKLLREKIVNMGNLEYSSLIELRANERDESEIISLKNALSRLSDEEREIVILYYCAGYSSKEIGKIMKLSDSTVRSKVMRANEKLRKYLEI